MTILLDQCILSTGSIATMGGENWLMGRGLGWNLSTIASFLQSSAICEHIHSVSMTLKFQRRRVVRGKISKNAPKEGNDEITAEEYCSR